MITVPSMWSFVDEEIKQAKKLANMEEFGEMFIRVDRTREKIRNNVRKQKNGRLESRTALPLLQRGQEC